MASAQQPNWLSLPVEIWLRILSLEILLRDLAEFCLTCSGFLSITRPILYRYLTLTAEKRDSTPNLAVTNTFALLARDPDLALTVRELTLDSHSKSQSYSRNPDLLNLPALRNLTQLKCVTLIGDISRLATRTTVAHFVEILHNLHLDTLRFPSPNVRPFILALNPAQLAQLANPRHLVLHAGQADHNALLVPQLNTILTTARTSLTSLSLTGRDVHLSVLFAVHFPLLRSLAIINLFDIQFSCPPGFNAFLSAHHETIQELHLGYTDRSNKRCPATILFDEASGLRPEFLPQLQVFRGHCSNLEMMASARMHCLGNLREVTTGSALQEPRLVIADIHRMLDALEAVGPLNALETLDCDVFQWRREEYDVIPTFVNRWAALCGPTLKVWRTLLPNQGSWPAELFTAFPHLRSIYFPRDIKTLSLLDISHRAAVPDEEVRKIAETCTALEEVNIVSSLVDDEEDICWKVYRSVLGLDVRQVSG
ncbi:BHLH domain-containing protein [Mycena sanguinolenta]|uniref:BHLH domain-containing protein n=1 Tax=Mycena sanguinolenta TaxID=230812 RepID=A0A8H6ZAD2_9AGAR|nr:BHLH domain-containing protein [Mycena sanguinolenta]